MTTWLLIIHVISSSINGPDAYYAIRFNSKKACEKEAFQVESDYREARCVEDEAVAPDVEVGQPGYINPSGDVLNGYQNNLEPK